MIILYQFPPAWGIPNPSPFCVKVEAYLRLAKIPYKNKYSINTNINPKKKFPLIKDGDEKIGDSEIIIDYLKEKYGDPLDADLSEQQKALGILIDRTFSDHLYWGAMYFRWNHEPEWTEIKKTFFGKVPKLLRSYIANKIKKSFCNALYGHGMGRHSIPEIIKMLDKDLFALSTLLADKPFFLGEKVSSVDCTAYGFLINLYQVPFQHDLLKIAEKYPNLKAYSQRMHELTGFSKTES